ncbi:WAP four-disulfide core domain-containing protein [Cinnamomum micranthum f. kanehirae]|uniref:WAP four-disulfide core domain-containing protein n=1 Tax=Cinnamomum micranthum f. kanehirae TaxID=337451 RepID=A0A3S4P605_9MAGN|nr:WAP four-disulfide core domain-containing protein [Cinnamomum micranthum f. kanehirae]
MKFEDFLMQRSEDHQKRLELQAEGEFYQINGTDDLAKVAKLQEELEEEEKLNRVLQCSLHGPHLVRSCLSSMLPLEVQVLLAEITMVEEEIVCLERKIEELKLNLYQEKQQTRIWKLQQKQQQQGHFLCGLRSRKEFGRIKQSPRPLANFEFRNRRLIRERRASLGSVSESTFTSSTRRGSERSRQSLEENQHQSLVNEQVNMEKPNRISEELIKCLIGIFLKLNYRQSHLDSESSAMVSKLTLSCMRSKGFMPKNSFDCKTPLSLAEDNKSMLDPYGVLPDLHGAVRDVGPYKYFIHLTRSSLDMTHISHCHPTIEKLRFLMLKLCSVDLSLLTYKQKLAFWINTYNVCIMHAFLQHGLPSTPEKLLALMNKAVLNVGGIVLNALAIEHFILRHPCDLRNGALDEKEALLRCAYGLGYPEPNVTFALCRGSWTSPALRVYTAEDVVSQLEKAKVEFLEASIGVSCKKKIIVPKLLHWHMRDFADDVESLVEWIYSQLPRSGSLKQLIMECLNGDSKLPIAKMVEIQPYESEFRYLLPLE